MSISLLNEVNKSRNSRWYPYLKQLPQSYDLLTSFGQFEIEAFQVRFLVDDTFIGSIWFYFSIRSILKLPSIGRDGFKSM